MLTTMAMAAQLAAPDAAALIVATEARCLSVMQGEIEPVREALDLSEDRRATIDLRRDGCFVTIDNWRGDASAFAQSVRDGLEARTGQWQVSQWRETVVNESGPSVWTTLIFPDIRRHSAYWMQIIEPAADAAGVLSVSYGIGS